ncbi:MAG: methyltransferase domain-containing protein [Rhodobacteraceae bacterium]|nr:methyltransferase domain-containing protein [Paracoccaceae bacterium]
MSATEQAVAQHYTSGALMMRIMGALAEQGVDPSRVTPADLKAGDEFHTGGVRATDHLFDQLDINSDTRVLDVGSGIGGTARYVAQRFGAAVTGVDLTPEFVTTAQRLSQMVGLGDKTVFHVASALRMPIADQSFDLAVMMHVGMNIADKAALMSEISRALVPGGTFAVFDVMQGERPGDVVYPLPWSERADTSFIAAPSDYRLAAHDAGLDLITETDRSDFAKSFFQKSFAKVAAQGSAPLGVHLMMGDRAGEKLGNYLKTIEAQRIAPTEMIFRKLI